MADNDILTYTGVYLDPFDIQPANIRIEDIAHALSMMTRANGHLLHFYSIAQHCANCAAEAKARGLSNKVQLVCLLHDAAESYISDVPRPVKNRLMGYKQAEQRIIDAVFEAFGITELTETEMDAVGEIDDAMLYYEFEALTKTHISRTRPPMAMQQDFSEKPMRDVERHFLNTFNALK